MKNASMLSKMTVRAKAIGSGAGERREGGDAAGAAAEEAPGEPAGEHRGGEGEEQGGETGGGLVGAEEALRRGVGGEVGHRLVEIGEAVEARQAEVAAGGHLARATSLLRPSSGSRRG